MSEKKTDKPVVDEYYVRPQAAWERMKDAKTVIRPYRSMARQVPERLPLWRISLPEDDPVISTWRIPEWKSLQASYRKK